jgi:hypothetical protein
VTKLPLEFAKGGNLSLPARTRQPISSFFPVRSGIAVVLLTALALAAPAGAAEPRLRAGVGQADGNVNGNALRLR